MKVFLQVTALSSCVAAWLVLAQRFALDGQSELCLKTHFEVRVQSLTHCVIYCYTTRCIAFIYEDGLCKIYNAGDLEATAGEHRLYRLYSGLVNVAVNKPVESSLQYSSKVAEQANDCDLTTIYHSKNGEAYAWWNVDLGSAVSIHAIRIYPDYTRQLYMNRFHNVEVSVGMEPAVGGDASTYTVLGFYAGPFPNSSCCSVDFFLDPPVSARYVHCRRTTALNVQQDYLIMKEVKVLTTEFF